MVNDSDSPLTDGEVLAQMVQVHAAFVTRAYELLRSVQNLVRDDELTVIYPTSAARNGNGTSFSLQQEWVQSYLGIVFVRSRFREKRPGGWYTQLPAEGFDLLVVQLRWLERSPREPMVWAIRARASSTEACDLEPYYYDMFKNIPQIAEASANEIPVRLQWTAKSPAKDSSGRVVTLVGSAIRVPFADLRTERDVLEKLVQPAMDLWRSAN